MTPAEPQPGDIIAGRWEITRKIGESPDPATPCDAATASVWQRPDGTVICRCTVCSRCHHHTGNAHQGHYWAACKVTRTTRESHFCCDDPEWGCELEMQRAEPQS